MPQSENSPFPREDEGMRHLHEDVATALERGLRQVGEVIAATFGEENAQVALRALLVDGCSHGRLRDEQRIEFDRIGWREFLDESGQVDSVYFSQSWRDGAEYAGQGTAPREPFDKPTSLADRQQRIEALIGYGRTMRAGGAALFGTDHLYIWEGVAARAAIDFGGSVTLEGLQLLGGVSLGAVRSAISIGELHPDADGKVAAEEARAWLARRRDFCPSRWKNPNDGQFAREEFEVAEPRVEGMIFIPQDADGVPFTPEHVVRSAKSAPGLSITVGAKGFEEQHRDFYAALTALAKMDVARWRRRNNAGNWGIVRARGAWVAVNKAEIDRQLALKLAEGA